MQQPSLSIRHPLRRDASRSDALQRLLVVRELLREAVRTIVGAVESPLRQAGAHDDVLRRAGLDDACLADLGLERDAAGARVDDAG